MARQKNISTAGSSLFITILLCVLLISSLSQADYMRLDPPPDVDKKAHGHYNTQTCWLATAANMLAGAGYDTGVTVQARADNIYNQLVAQYGTATPGWTDVAAKWWLQSAHNTQKTINPYTAVTVHGNKTKTPWLHDPNFLGFFLKSDDAPRFLGNELRREQLVGVSINFGTTGGGHAFTAWGDTNDVNTLTDNPKKLIVTDSDKDFGGDTQTYTYTLGTTGWFLNYNNYPFIKHIVTLCPVDDVNDPNAVTTQTVAGSYKIYNSHQFCLDCNAVGVNYKTSSNLPILSYRTGIDWQTSNPLNVQEDPCTPRKWITGDCNFSDNPVGHGNGFTIDTELVLPYGTNIPANISKTNIVLVYPPSETPLLKLGFDCGILTPIIFGADANDPDITGGFVISAFDVFSSAGGGGSNLIGQFRSCSEYEYFQNPESHQFSIVSLETSPQEDCFIGNFQFGHSYGLLTGNQLWTFDEWLTEEYMADPYQSFEPGSQIDIPLDWTGVLPYPAGEDYNEPPLPEECGQAGTVYLSADLNHDCYVNFRDFAEFAIDWMQCSDPQGAECIAYD